MAATETKLEAGGVCTLQDFAHMTTQLFRGGQLSERDHLDIAGQTGRYECRQHYVTNIMLFAPSTASNNNYTKKSRNNQ